MSSAESFLRDLLNRQRLGDQDPEVKQLIERRKDVEAVLRSACGQFCPSIRWGGSRAKGTMVRDLYDGDMTCYFPRDQVGVGGALSEIYGNVATALEEQFLVVRKPSSLRVTSVPTGIGPGEDLHIDVIPGRYVVGNSGDVHLHQNDRSKAYLKTNLDVHIAFIRDSGFTDAISLFKIWNIRNGLLIKTFVLELLVVNLLRGTRLDGLADQFRRVLETSVKYPAQLNVQDPANPDGNDLSEYLASVRTELPKVAARSLELIRSAQWGDLFCEGTTVHNPASVRIVSLSQAAAQVPPRSRAWCGSHE